MAEKGEKTPQKNNRKKIATIALGIVMVFVFGWIFIFLSKKPVKKFPPQGETQEESAIQQSESSTGLGVTRSEIIGYFGKKDPSFIFEPADPVKGYENHIAVKGTTFAQVIGYEEEPVLASINGYYGAEGPNFLSKADVFGFGTFFDKDANDWLESQFARLDTEGCAGFEGRSELGSIEYSLTCDVMAPYQNMLSLVVREISARLSF